MSSPSCLFFSLLLLQAPSALPHPNQPIHAQSAHSIKDNIYQDNAKIPPTILVPNVDRAEILIRIAQLAKLTVLGVTHIDQVSARRRDVGGHVLPTRLSCGREKLDVFIRCTDDLCIGHTSREKTGGEPRERRDVVHECPESR